jgi:hypothetical protein
MSTNTQLSIVDQLKNEINNIKDKIKGADISSAVFDTLGNSAKLLQGKLNDLLGKGGLYTQSDVNDAYLVLQEEKRKQLELESKKAKKKAYMYLGIGAFTIIGVILLLRQKNK